MVSWDVARVGDPRCSPGCLHSGPGVGRPCGRTSRPADREAVGHRLASLEAKTLTKPVCCGAIRTLIKPVCCGVIRARSEIHRPGPVSRAIRKASRVRSAATARPLAAVSTTMSSPRPVDPDGRGDSTKVGVPTIVADVRATSPVVASHDTIRSIAWRSRGLAVADNCGKSRPKASTSSSLASRVISTRTSMAGAHPPTGLAGLEKSRWATPPCEVPAEHRLACSCISPGHSIGITTAAAP